MLLKFGLFLQRRNFGVKVWVAIQENELVYWGGFPLPIQLWGIMGKRRNGVWRNVQVENGLNAI